MLDHLGLEDVTVIGNSVGGWIAAEMALLGSPRISGIVLLDAVGIEVEGHPVADVSGLSVPEIQALSFHDPTPFRVDPTTIPDGQKAIMAANGAALAVYAGSAAMADPTLRGRLGVVAIPTLVLWGENDQIVPPAYGQAYAAAIPGARFEVLPATGHIPRWRLPISFSMQQPSSSALRPRASSVVVIFGQGGLLEPDCDLGRRLPMPVIESSTSSRVAGSTVRTFPSQPR